MMAFFTIFRTRHMVGTLALLGDIVVTAGAARSNPEMVESSSQPTRGGMAKFAILGTLHVQGILPDGFAPVMAGLATRLNLAMVDPRRHPGIVQMAEIAIVSGHDVIAILGGLRAKTGAVVT
jgi:hypothetical protein